MLLSCAACDVYRQAGSQAGKLHFKHGAHALIFIMRQARTHARTPTQYSFQFVRVCGQCNWNANCCAFHKTRHAQSSNNNMRHALAIRYNDTWISSSIQRRHFILYKIFVRCFDILNLLENKTRARAIDLLTRVHLIQPDSV